VLEFWATWCGPCKAAMPHLTKLQKKHEGKITVIGVDVWEKLEEGKPYESALPYVTKFVKGNDANMGYSVIADNNDLHMVNKWLKPAGINGIPSTFVIKNQQIIWIGHPIKLDSTLDLVFNGTYNMAEYKLAYEKRAAESQKMIADMRNAQKPVEEALKAKDYKKAFELMEKAKKDAPILKYSMDFLKFTTLLQHVSEAEAIAYAKEWQREYASAATMCLSEVVKHDNLSKDTYVWAAKNVEEANAKSTRPPNPVLLHMLASCYAKAGDFTNAIATEEKAVEGAKKALSEGTMIGTIMDYTVKEYEESLADYKSGRLSKK
jgi:thiol-disulfide isomerase/thioredoxin